MRSIADIGHRRAAIDSFDEWEYAQVSEAVTAATA
jgi:hypothetical protein